MNNFLTLCCRSHHRQPVRGREQNELQYHHFGSNLMARLSIILQLTDMIIGLCIGNLLDLKSVNPPPQYTSGPLDTTTSRSPRPALTSIAKRGFIPHSDRYTKLAQIILGLSQGLGVSPKVSGFIGAIGMIPSIHPLTFTFDLDDLSRHLFAVEHDCSFYRQDALIGNNSVFNSELWNVALVEFEPFHFRYTNASRACQINADAGPDSS